MVCHCGYSMDRHDPPNEDQMDLSLLILFKLAMVVYPKLHRLDAYGSTKTEVEKIRGCEECGCTDYRKYPNWEYCYYSHKNASHTNEPTSVVKMREALVEILAESLYQSLSNRNTGKYGKKFLYQIKPCFKSGCRDFNYSYTVPFKLIDMCKCGSSEKSHMSYCEATGRRYRNESGFSWTD